MCEVAREHVCVGRHGVGRVIARPFTGTPGAYARLSDKRRDYSLPPPGPTLLDRLQDAGVETVAVGKIASLFNGQGVSREVKTAGNADGVEQTLAAMVDAHDGHDTFVWTNLVDFDELFGHRNDPAGFAAALEAFDAALPRLEAALPPGAVLMLTADHGNDPTTPGSDHTRERVPLLVFDGAPGRPLGDGVFSDHARRVLEAFGLGGMGGGEWGPAKRTA
jgi:phosphopentomutase